MSCAAAVLGAERACPRVFLRAHARGWHRRRGVSAQADRCQGARAASLRERFGGRWPSLASGTMLGASASQSKE
eukprot:6028369-Alexandrium_andersonii.AAC.1